MNPRTPLPFRLEYETWIETHDWHTSGRFTNWLAGTVGSILSRLMRVWPHKHALWVEMDNRSVVCVYLCGYHRQKCRSTDV